VSEPTSRLQRRQAERAAHTRRLRRIRYASVALLAAATMVASILVATSGHGSHNPPPVARPNACAPAVASLTTLPVGVASGDIFGTATTAELDGYMHTTATLDLDHVRVDFGLSTAQWKAGGQYHWQTFCRVARAASRQGLKVHAILDQFPAWMKQSPKALAQACLSFAKTFAGSNVSAIEFENEPNVKPEYAHHPDVYMARYTACYHSVHQVALTSHWNVVFEPGGTAPVGTEDATDVRPDTWYQNLYGFGLANMSCNTTLHPYDWPMTVTPKDPAWHQVSAVHAIMARNHRGRCRIDITEMGFPTDGGNRPPATARYPEWHDSQPVSVLNQARFTMDALHSWFPLYKAGITGAFDVYTLIDNPRVDGTEGHFGIYFAYQGNPLIPGSPKATPLPERGTDGPASTAAAIQTFLAGHAPQSPPLKVVKSQARRPAGPGPRPNRHTLITTSHYDIVRLPENTGAPAHRHLEVMQWRTIQL
jgi:hypothetical protein